MKIYHFNTIFLDLNEKNSFLKLLLRFSQNVVFSQKNWNSSLISRAIPNIFFYLKVSVRVNFCPDGFFIVGSSAEKSGIYCRRITVF